MSDFILKFWPTKEVSEIKTAKIVSELKARGILGEETVHWGKAAFKIGDAALKLLLPISNYDMNSPYVQQLALIIEENGYGVGFGEEDFEFYDRHNVISVYGGDGELDHSKMFCQILFEITEDEYSVEFEIL